MPITKIVTDSGRVDNDVQPQASVEQTAKQGQRLRPLAGTRHVTLERCTFDTVRNSHVRTVK